MCFDEWKGKIIQDHIHTQIFTCKNVFFSDMPCHEATHVEYKAQISRFPREQPASRRQKEGILRGKDTPRQYVDINPCFTALRLDLYSTRDNAI